MEKQETEEDLIDLMTCKNCINLISEGGKIYCKEHPTADFVDSDTGESRYEYEETQLDSHCSTWEKKVEKGYTIKELYVGIKEILKEFVDTSEPNREIITLWILGTWMHKDFETYPYLFINAMKGSGKTRLLKLIKELSWQGDLLASLSEAVLFRTTGTLCIDEFEGVSGKDKNALRELLNTAYKKGGKVKRMRKKKSVDGEEQVVEEFSTFRPVVMANIRGMEEVLGDRCIPIILEKSDNKSITRKIENFDSHPKMLEIKENLINTNFWCSLVKCSCCKTMYIEWNKYISTPIYTTHNTTYNYTHIHLFKKIDKTGIDGRNLELSFPLLILAEEIGIIDDVIEILKNIIAEKKEEDMMEGRDVMLMSYVSKQEKNMWHKIKEILTVFGSGIAYDSDENHWLNSKWIGQALRRLNLIINKRRTGQGVEVILNIDKAKDKMKIFNPETKDEKKPISN